MPKKTFFFMGIGLDSDGHKHVTRAEDFTLVGGSKETHEQMQETAIKISERLKGKDVTPRLFQDIVLEVTNK